MHQVVDVKLGKDILAENRALAAENLKYLKKNGVRVFDFMGAIGSGKTLIIEQIIKKLKKRKIKVAVIAGDVAGDDDYRRFRKHGVTAVNINTGKECHLDAHSIGHAIEHMDLRNVDVLFIENVGNLVCPADFALGSEKRVVIISTTEGDDMVRKHPVIFATSDIAVLNKTDLARYVGVDTKRILKDYKKMNPGGKMILMNAKKGIGVDELIERLGI